MEKSLIKIAVVDDHTLFRQGLVQLLSLFPDLQVVIQASNGEKFLQELEKATELPDICLLDVNMPGLNGFKTMSIIAEKWKDLKVLAVSMHDNEYATIRMLRNGARGYILKTADPDELHNAITAVYEKGYYLTEDISGRFMKHLHNDPDDIPLLELTDKEIEYLNYLACDLGIKEIAEKMEMKTRTLEKHIEILSKKLQIKTRIGMVMFAIKSGIVSIMQD
jgi:DNA-binding NarL/FixJ family response regulator